MSHFQFKRVQHLNTDIDTIWDFASSPKNLKEITPDHMLFNITSDVAEKMYPGMIVTYEVAPLLGIKLDWVTEITQVRDKSFFIDEQKVGPYQLWHHQHIFESTDAGVSMTDIITYKPPFGILGNLLNSLFIKKQLNAIFDYRKKVMEQLFNPS